jgi:hypothetical protein
MTCLVHRLCREITNEQYLLLENMISKANW